MSRLEDLTVGSIVSGLVNNEAVQVVAVKWYGNAVLELTFKNSQGIPANQLLYREDEARLEVQEDNLPWSFDANGDDVRLASEAYRTPFEADTAVRAFGRPAIMFRDLEALMESEAGKQKAWKLLKSLPRR